MKKYFMIIFFIFISTNIFAQKSLWPVDVEIFLIIDGLENSNEVGFKMTTQSFVWKLKGGTQQQWTFEDSNNIYDLAFWPDEDLEPWPTECETSGNTNLPWAYGFNICGSNSFDQPTVGHGLYQLKIYDNFCQFLPITFYLDYRDCDYPIRNRPDGSPSPYQDVSGGNDIWILYDANTSKCSLSVSGLNNFQEISNNEYLSIWEIKQKSTLSPSTYYFPNYWQNCLAVITSQTGNHSRLVWGAYPNESFNVTNYRIYRKIDNHNWLFCGQTNSSTYTFVDSEIETGNKSGVVKYYVKAYNGTTESEATNTVETFYEEYNPHKEAVKKINNEPKEYSLSQNYPNPGNPSTTISYSIAQDGFVNLTVYDILGREVAELVNEEKPAGNYIVNFNAANLSSGVYFYKLTSSYPSTSSGQGFISIKELNVLK